MVLFVIFLVSICPHYFHDAALFTIRGPRLRHQARIPSNIFRPEATTIPFFVEASDASLTLSVPRWNTHALHAPQQGNSIGSAGSFRIDASYRYFAEVREDNVEQLRLDFSVRTP